MGPRPDWALGAPCVGLLLALICRVHPPLGLLVWNTHLPLRMRRATPRPASAYFSPLGICAPCARRDAGFELPMSLLQPSVSFLKICSGFSCLEGGQSQVWTSALGWGRPGFCLCHDGPSG